MLFYLLTTPEFAWLTTSIFFAFTTIVFALRIPIFSDLFHTH